MLRTVSTINIFVNNFDESVQFYSEKLQLPLQFKGKDSAHFLLKNIDLNIEYVDPKNKALSKRQVGRFLGISLDVTDINAAYKELRERGVKFVDEPTNMPHGGICANFIDPDENCLSLVQY